MRKPRDIGSASLQLRPLAGGQDPHLHRRRVKARSARRTHAPGVVDRVAGAGATQARTCPSGSEPRAPERSPPPRARRARGPDAPDRASVPTRTPGAARRQPSRAAPTSRRTGPCRPQSRPTCEPLITYPIGWAPGPNGRAPPVVRRRRRGHAHRSDARRFPGRQLGDRRQPVASEPLCPPGAGPRSASRDRRRATTRRECDRRAGARAARSRLSRPHRAPPVARSGPGGRCGRGAPGRSAAGLRRARPEPWHGRAT